MIGKDPKLPDFAYFYRRSDFGYLWQSLAIFDT